VRGDVLDVPPALDVVRREVRLGLRTRFALLLMRTFLKPLLARMVRQDFEGIARTQLQVASMRCPDTAGQPLDYRLIGRVAGHVIGALDEQAPVILWLHGGAFILPAAPNVHFTLIARLCRDLGASAFVPDYRLAPYNRFPAGLDDCERAYRELLARGHRPERIVLAGDSAGGNLLFGVLQRIRAARLPMPACAIAISPVVEMGRIHAPPSRHSRMRADPLLPIVALQRVDDLYAGDWDASDPELSPLYMDCAGLPPLLLTAGDNEILVDEVVLLARRAHAAGVPTRCDVWCGLPHAFVLFEGWFPEVQPAREDLAAFARRHLQ
jgi:monoterpene epsilon-lactone hydrolase